MQQQLTQRRFENYYDQTNQVIGKGAFAEVFLARRRSTGELVAVKIIDRNNAISFKEREILLQLSKYTHPNVVSILDIFEQGQSIFIVQEYCVGGTLYEMMLNGPIPEDQVVEVILQLAEGINFLHGTGIVHRDIKPENVLKQKMKDGRDVYKITDFGLSSTKELVMTSKIGTAYYVSPEIVDGRAEKEGYDRTIDIWALGLVFDELLHGTTYYNAGTEEEVFTKIRNEPYVIRDKSYNEASFFDTMNFIIQQVLLNTIQREPSKRKDLSWVIDQLTQYKILKYKQSQPELKKPLKSIDLQQQPQIQEDFFDFLNPSLQHDHKIKSQNITTINSPMSSGISTQKTTVQQIQQKYWNLQQISSNNAPKSLWDSGGDSDQICKDHRLPIKFRMPISTIDEKVQVTPACVKCLQHIGVIESDFLQKMVDEALQLFQTRRFEHFYKPTEVEVRIQQMMDRAQMGDIEIRESQQLMLQYHLICEKYENDGRQQFNSRVQQLEKFRQRGYVCEDGWVGDCLIIKKGSQDENIFTLGMRREMKEIGDLSIEECRRLLQEQFQLMIKSLKNKLDMTTKD